MTARSWNWAKAALILSFGLTLTAYSGHTTMTSVPGISLHWGDERAATGATDSDESSEYGHLLPRPQPQMSPVVPPPVPPRQNLPPQMMMSVQSRSGNQMTLWDMCDRRATIRAAKGHGSATGDVPCFDRRGQPTQGYERIHPILVRYMEAYLLTCSQHAARAAGFPRPVKLFLNISGAYSYRNVAGRARLSQHAYGRALDIYDMSLIDADGKRTWIDTHLRGHRNPANRSFFSTFRRCWDAKLGCDEVNGSIGHVHSPGESNSAHNDHLHLQASDGCRGPR